MKRAMHALLALAVAGIGTSAIAAGQATATSSQLGMFVGTWRGSGNLTTNPGKSPMRMRSTIDCKWSSDAHVFLVCNGVAYIGDKPDPQYQLSVYRWDPSAHQYGFTGISMQGTATPDFSLSGNTWSYSGKFTDKDGKTRWFRTLNIFDSPDRYRYEIQNSDDGEHWTTTGSGESHKQ